MTPERQIPQGDRAARRGAVTVSIAALDRASSLVTDKAREAELLLRASESAVELGRGPLALDLASRADVRQVEPFGDARTLIIRAGVNPGVTDGGTVTGSGVAVTEFVEAARSFGENILQQAGSTTDGRLTWAFRQALSRNPPPASQDSAAPRLSGQTSRPCRCE